MALCTIFTILLTLWNSKQKNGLLIKRFCFSFNFDETWWSCYPCVLQFHQVSSKSDEKQKSFINSPFFCSEFQSVSRIMKIVHSDPYSTNPFKPFHFFVAFSLWCNNVTSSKLHFCSDFSEHCVFIIQSLTWLESIGMASSILVYVLGVCACLSLTLTP